MDWWDAEDDHIIYDITVFLGGKDRSYGRGFQ